jgi:hypothetical protein
MLYEMPKGETSHDSIIPFMGGKIKFRVPKTKDELSEYLRTIANVLTEKTLFFALRQNGNIWRLYRDGEEENEFKELLSNQL